MPRRHGPLNIAVMDIENRYGTLEMQKALLILLDAFNRHCAAYGISYSLCSGSLLGAVRRGGFIPWDDDIDVLMDRENYYRLKGSFHIGEELVFVPAEKTDNWIDRIRLANPGRRSGSEPTLDVFILDVVPASHLLERMKTVAVLLLQGMIKPRLVLDKGSFLMKAGSVISWLMGRPFSMRTKMHWYHSVAQWGSKAPSGVKAMWIDQYKGIGKRYPSDILHAFEMHRFEDTQASIMSAYDAYLRVAYGDNYMIPPDEKDRIPVHMATDLRRK